MANVFQLMPNLDSEEMPYIQNMIKDLSDDKAQQFAMLYNSRRKEPQLILLTTLLGFIVIAGVQRFILGQIGMGLLYLFTFGLCFIGTIIDLVNYKKLAFEYNFKIANEVMMMLRST
jgi:TM2 domain-containing membrane protein YozV